MITDKTIDKKSLRYWSIFRNKKFDFANIIAEIDKECKSGNEDLYQLYNNTDADTDTDTNDNINEGIGSAIGKGIAASAKAAGKGIAAGSKYVGKGIAKGAKYAGKGIAKGAKYTGTKIVNGSKKAVKSALKHPFKTMSIVAAGYTGYKVIKSVNDISNYVKNIFNKQPFLSTLGIAAILVAIAIRYLDKLTGGMTSNAKTVIKDVVEEIKTNKYIAKVSFMSDNQNYNAIFDSEKYAWRLLNDDNTDADPENAKTFFKSDTFKEIGQQMQDHFKSYLTNKNLVALLTANNSSELKKIHNNELAEIAKVTLKHAKTVINNIKDKAVA